VNPEFFAGEAPPVCRFFRARADAGYICPGLRFEAIGRANSPDDGVAQRTVERARRMPNVALFDPMPYAQLDAHYRRALVLMCTSKWEGFPNTFLEAWSRGIPTVSTVDPDGIIEARNPTGGQFGLDGLQRAMTDCGGDVFCVVESVMQILKRHEQGGRPDDDQTLLALQIVE